MFENSGGKIKILALICFWLGVIGSILTGLAFITSFGIIIILLGVFSSWLSTIVLYGIGEGVENTESANLKLQQLQGELDDLQEKIEKLIGGKNITTEKHNPAEVYLENKSEELKEQRLKNLKKLAESGVLSEEAYKDSVEKLEAEYKENEELARPGKKLNINFSEENGNPEARKWKCIKCGKRINTLPCPYCSNK